MDLAKRLILAAAIACMAGWPMASQAALSTPTIGGGVVFTYKFKPNDNSSHRRGGNYGLDYFLLNAKGKVKTGKQSDITYAAEYRLLTQGYRWLHYGWAAYNYGAHQSIRGGYFQVPFGNLPYGYDSFYGGLGYYLGLRDNQSLGFGYKYQKGPWRFDIDFFKNDTAGQTQTYGVNTTSDDPFQTENTGNIRIAYTYNKGSAKNATFSLSGKGGQLFANDQDLLSGGTPTTDAEGYRWAVAVAMDANWGLWNLKLGATDYAYNVPKGSAITNIDRGTIQAQDYGFNTTLPAGGQLFNASLSRVFKVSLGPISSITPYIDYGYLRVNNNVDYVSNSSGSKRIGDEQLIDPGIEWVAGPVYVWTEWLVGKNTGGTAFVGEDDGSWNNEIYVATGFYF